ncbi:MAG: hypothetical protein WCF12_06040 [Propionicimonas sp.]
MESASPEGVFALRLAVWKYAGLVRPASPWISELDRFDELVFALFTRISDRTEFEVRQLVEELRALGLLDVPTLAAVPLEAGQQAPAEDPAVQQLVRTIGDSGLTDEMSWRMTVTLVELAHALERGYDGKLQRYLRRYGERMLTELGDSFSFSQLPQEQVLDAFTYWLQNALLMPLSLVDDSVQGFAKRHGLTESDLIASADEIGLNLAWMDDVLEAAARSSATAEAAPARAEE